MGLKCIELSTGVSFETLEKFEFDHNVIILYLNMKENSRNRTQHFVSVSSLTGFVLSYENIVKFTIHFSPGITRINKLAGC